MKLLYVYKDYYPVIGGIENNLRDLAEAFAARGHAVTVLVTNPGPRTVEEQLNGVRVIKVGRFASLASTPLSFDFPRVLRSLAADLTHLHLPYPVGEVSQLLAGRERKYVVTYHADVTRPVQVAIMRLYAPVLRAVLQRAARIVATSPNYVASSPYLRPLEDRVSIVTSSVDPRRFAGEVNRPDGPPTILFVGLLRHYKGVDFLIRAMAHVPPEARLLIGGAGPQRAEWEALTDMLNLRDRVTFLGRVPEADLPGLYQSAHIFALPATTRAEALGLVTVEAMASGLPCVTTEIGSGTSYLVQDGVTGFVVPPRSPEALGQALTRLVRDRELRLRLGAAGQHRALENFTLEKMIERMEEVYRLALNS